MTLERDHNCVGAHLAGGSSRDAHSGKPLCKCTLAALAGVLVAGRFFSRPDWPWPNARRSRRVSNITHLLIRLPTVAIICPVFAAPDRANHRSIASPKSAHVLLTARSRTATRMSALCAAGQRHACFEQFV